MSSMSAGACFSYWLLAWAREGGARGTEGSLFYGYRSTFLGQSCGSVVYDVYVPVRFLPILPFHICQSGGKVLYMGHTSLLYILSTSIREGEAYGWRRTLFYLYLSWLSGKPYVYDHWSFFVIMYFSELKATWATPLGSSGNKYVQDDSSCTCEVDLKGWTCGKSSGLPYVVVSAQGAW